MPAASSRADAAAESAEHLGERLPQHLAPLTEGGVDEREGVDPLRLGAGQLAARSNADQDRVDVRHRPEHLPAHHARGRQRRTRPPSRSASRRPSIRAAPRCRWPTSACTITRRGSRLGTVLEQVQQHGHRDVVRQVRDEPDRASPGSSSDAQRVLVRPR